MRKLLTIIGGSFFGIEAIGLAVYLLGITISADKVATIVPWVIGGAINIAFLVILLSGVFDKK